MQKLSYIFVWLTVLYFSVDQLYLYGNNSISEHPLYSWSSTKGATTA